MSLSTQSFDQQLEMLVNTQFPEETAKRLVLDYLRAQTVLRDQVYPNIVGTEPSLTDHGSRHVANVKQNAIRLLSNDGRVNTLSGIEMYFLGMCILFHDVGVVYGRTGHNNNIARVFDCTRGTDDSVRHERTLVVRATRAHTGMAQDGSRDTLKELVKEDHLQGERIRLRELAAILRFADELAEGPHRTSRFMQSELLYESNSQQFHEYSNATNVFIQRENNRIVLTYEIVIKPCWHSTQRRRRLSDGLTVIYNRIKKLNQERQYARYYSTLLEPFRSTEATFNFHYGDDVLDTDLDSIKMTDIVVPGDDAKDIPDIDAQYAIDVLVPNILSQCTSTRVFAQDTE